MKKKNPVIFISLKITKILFYIHKYFHIRHQKPPFHSLNQFFSSFSILTNTHTIKKKKYVEKS